MSRERRIFLNDQRSLAQIRRREMQQILEDDVSSDEEESKKRLASYPPVSHDEASLITTELLSANPDTYPLERLEYVVKHLRYWINMQDQYTLTLASNEKLIHAIVAYLESTYLHYISGSWKGEGGDSLLTVIYEITWLLSSLSYYSESAERILYQKYEFLLKILSDLKHTPASETLCIIILNITSSKQIHLTPLECAIILRFFYKHLLLEYPILFAQASQKSQEKLEISFISKYAMYIIGNLVYAMISYYETYFPLSYLQAGTDDDYHEFDFIEERDIMSTCCYAGKQHHPYLCPSFVAELEMAGVSSEERAKIEDDFLSISFTQQTIFIFRAFLHIFELGIFMFMLLPPANGSVMNRILYMLAALLETHVVSCWSCAELSIVYSVAFIDKLFLLLSLRKKNLTSLIVSMINKVIQSRSIYEELYLKDKVEATCTDPFIAAQVPSLSSLLIHAPIYDIGGSLHSPSLVVLVEKIFTHIVPFSTNINIKISSGISDLLLYLINNFLETVYPHEQLFDKYVKILKSMPVNKVSTTLYSLIDILITKEINHTDVWKSIYDMLLYFYRFGNSKKKFKTVLVGFVIKLLEAYPSTIEFFLAVGGEGFVIENLDQPLFKKIAGELEGFS